jgi:exopolysaccharide biosynthesis polyprenyl glycosylphosphotransferase
VANAERRAGGWRFREGERRLLLILGDLIAGVAATMVALALWAQLDWFGFSWEFIRFRAGWVVFLPLAWIVLLVNLYDLRRAGSWGQTVRGVLIAAGIGLALYTFVYFLPDQPGSLPRRGPLYFLFFASILTIGWRWLYIRIFTAPAFLRRALIVGAGDSGRAMVNVIHAMEPAPYHLVGLIDDDPTKAGGVVQGEPILGGNERLLEVVEAEAVSDLIVAITGAMHGDMFKTLLDAQERGVEVTRMPVAYEELLSRLPIEHLEADWILRSFVDQIRVSGIYQVSKRLLDIGGALVGLTGLLLMLPWISLAILIESGRPIFFRQERLGQGGHIFHVLKLRTMQQDAEADGQAHWAQEGDPRATTIGRLLRAAHVDESPQFWNVLTGDMSLVGPRPERPELVRELEDEIPFYRARLLVKPGITGWAQVNYGKGASIQGSAEKLEYDLFYIKHRSLLLDLWIILRTIGAVFGLQGV